MTCKKCGDKKYTGKIRQLDGSTTFAVCDCTGITADKLEELAEYIRTNGELTVQLPEDALDKGEE